MALFKKGSFHESLARGFMYHHANEITTRMFTLRKSWCATKLCAQHRVRCCSSFTLELPISTDDAHFPTHESDYSFCIMHKLWCRGWIHAVSEWKKIAMLRVQSFFLFISVHIRISVAKHTMLCTQHIDWNYYDAVFSFPSLLPSVQHTSRWPSPWSSDSLSDERSIAFSLVHIYFFCIFKKVFIRAARVCIR